MTKERNQHLHLPLLRRIKWLAAVATAGAALIISVDHAYSRARDSKLGRDAVVQLERLIHSRAKTSHFELEVSGEPFATDPQGTAIKSAVLAAAANTEGNNFLILLRSDDEFIQAAPVRGGWTVEFRVTSLGGGSINAGAIWLRKARHPRHGHPSLRALPLEQ
jgi:hypothetical protein